MPVPSAYTENELGQYMITVLGDLGVLLDFTSPNDFREEITDSLLMYGADSIDAATDIQKIRVCARYAAWRKATSALVTRYNFQTDQQRFDRADMGKMAKAQFLMAESDATALGLTPGLTIGLGTITPEVDPYSIVSDRDYEELSL